jgi:rod shape-determining protein MreC
MRIKALGATGRLTFVRALFHRFAFPFLVCAALLLMAVGKNEGVLVERTRAVVLEILTPVFDVLSRPASAISNSVDFVRQLTNLRAENERLRAENQKLSHWHTIAAKLSSENAVLHQQLNFVPEPDPAFITARVIGDVASGFGQSLLLGAGARDGVRKGQAVVSGEYLVGYISQVADHVSRLLLLTDINAHLPVTVDSTHTRAILSGDNREMPRLDYLSGNSNIQVGDLVVTSASGAAFPPGLTVGTISGVTDGIYRVSPAVRRDQLEYVAIVDYGLGGVQSFTDKPPPPSSGRRGKNAKAEGAEPN